MKDIYEIRYDPNINNYRLYKILKTYRSARIYPSGDLQHVLGQLSSLINNKISTETVMHITLEY